MLRPRSRPGGLAFALTALLAGCSTAQPPLVTTSWDGAASGGSVLLLRILPAEGGPAAMAQAWRFDGRNEPNEFRSLPDGAGWRSQAAHSGRHFLRLRASPDAPPQDFTVTIPTGQATLDLGTFRQDCTTGVPCQLVRETRPASEAAAAVPPQYRERLPVVVMPMQPYPPRLAGSGLPAPTAPTVRVDPVSWVAAVDWSALAEEGGDLGPPQGDYTRGGMGEALAAPFALAAAGPAIVVVAALVVLVPIALVALIVKSERERRDNAAAADARSRELALQARVQEARAAWSPCEATIGAALSPDSVARHLQSALPRPRSRPSEGSAWEATVSRVVLRHCGQGSATFGVEVATEWTGRAPGVEAPAYRASFVRPVQGAAPDRRLRWSTPAPWEIPVAPSGACRPLAEWCADGGRALLDEVARSVTGARDAIAATR
jgi:hypothetical protein